jgi:hypothetical protein
MEEREEMDIISWGKSEGFIYPVVSRVLMAAGFAT